MKNYPELLYYRDIIFWWKFYLNPNRTAFPNYCGPGDCRDLPRYDRMNAQLVFQWAGNAYNVSALGTSLQTKPPVAPGTEPPKHRFPSTATPSFFVPAPPIKTEDDVIYRPSLPDFGDKHGQV